MHLYQNKQQKHNHIIMDTCVNDPCPILSNTRYMRRQVMSARSSTVRKVANARRRMKMSQHVCANIYCVLLREKWKLKKRSLVCTCFARFRFGGRLLSSQTEDAGVSNKSSCCGSGWVGIANCNRRDIRWN